MAGVLSEGGRRRRYDAACSRVVRHKFSTSLRFGVLLSVPTIPKDTAQLKSVARVISSCFDPYMGAYVKFERK